MMRRLDIISLLFFTLYSSLSYAAPCVNMCSGHGLCNSRKCTCFEGYQGGDCSEYICPFGKAWTDQAIGIDDAHNDAECSNMGICDRSTGICQCRDGFEGKACERKKCPYDCSGNGKCQSMEYYASIKNPGEGTVYAYSTIWDAQLMYGCNCDPGFHGPDCSLRYCPKGDDPLTGNSADTKGNPKQFNEVQKVVCRAGSGYFTLSFRDKTTKRIPYNAKAQDIVNYLQDLPTIGAVKVVMYANPGQACLDVAASDGTSWTVEFLDNFGDVPMLVVDSSGLNFGNEVYTVVLDVAEQRKGTKEDEECSNRGICDSSSGVCTCEVGYDTSNGYDKPGTRGDCGLVDSTIQQCPGVLSCSGHGECSNSPKFRCACSEGWTGADCSERVCPHGTSWFTRPQADNLAHVYEFAECSDMGVCNRETGECQCMPGFTGASCNRLACASLDDETTCSGHGQCYDMSQLAEKAEVNGDAADFTYGATPNKPETWDAFRMQGCLCDDLWTGYDCSLRLCPFGDDPQTENQFNEVQQISCTDADASGNVVLTFKQVDTTQLSVTTTIAELKAALEAIPLVGEVNVEIDGVGSDSLCTAGGNTFLITFLTAHGDLPTILYAEENIDSFDIQEYTKGTKEHIECSGRGLCDRATGVCSCFNGFGSSNGKGGVGNVGDCGYCEPIYEHLEA